MLGLLCACVYKGATTLRGRRSGSRADDLPSRGFWSPGQQRRLRDAGKTGGTSDVYGKKEKKRRFKPVRDSRKSWNCGRLKNSGNMGVVWGRVEDKSRAGVLSLVGLETGRGNRT
jgi:hypothetical protein